MATISELRAARAMHGDPSILHDHHVAYLGLYNPKDHLDAAVNWLSDLDDCQTTLLVADNKSTDSSWELVRSAIAQVYPKSFFVQHFTNLGGYGGLFTNLDLLENAKWVTTFHQDDLYKPDHLSVHKKLAQKAEANIAIIASEQESFSSTGKRMGYPRASWLMDTSPDPATLFLANLRHHTLPFSGATFRVEMLRETEIPWHSTSFPDTEIVLRMLPKWTGFVDDKSIVRYLENPLSESHSINNQERSFGAAMAMTRVLSSSGFVEVCRLVPQREIPNFIDSLLSGLRHRISDDGQYSFVSTLALEVMFVTFGPHAEVTKRLEETYALLDAPAASAVLHRLHSFPVSPKDAKCFAKVGDREPLAPTSRFASSLITRVKQAIVILAGLLSRRTRKALVLTVTWLAKRLGIRSSWDFDWRK